MKQVDNQREYDIKKGQILEGFDDKFHERYKQNTLYSHVRELLIREADPYRIIEKLIEINDEQFEKMCDVMPFVSPNYAIHKKQTGKPL